MGGETNLYVVIIAILTLIGTIFNAWLTWKREARNRQWLIEDQRSKEDLLREHLDLKQKVVENTALTQAMKDENGAAIKEASLKLSDSQKLTVEAVKAVTEAIKPRLITERTRSTDG